MKSIYIILAIITLASCETVVEVDVPITPAKLVANSFIHLDSTIALRVSASKHVLDIADLKGVRNANVTIFENGQKLETMTAADSLEGWYTSTIKPLPGREYTLQAEAPGFEAVEASAQAVPVVPIKELTYTVRREPNGQSCYNDSCYTVYDDTYRFALTLDDPADQQNYYEIRGFADQQAIYPSYDEQGNIVGYDTIYNSQQLYLTVDDATDSDSEFDFNDSYGESVLLSDDLFNGQQYTVRISPDYLYYQSYEESKLTIRIELLNMDENRYLYLRTKDVQYANDGNPFAEPINVYSNITNGYGIFGSYSVATYTIILE